MKKLLFADLDDTLFQSERKQVPGADWLPIAYLAGGQPISYANPAQLELLALFQREMILIPVTARNHDAFRRVRIDFPAEAILNYGGIIINADGTPDAAWLQASRAAAAQSLALLQEWMEALERENAALDAGAHIRLIHDFDTAFYVVAKSRRGDLAALAALAHACREARSAGRLPDVAIHHNHNNLALIPRWLDKQHAVDHLRRRYEAACGEVLTFGMGDSFVDLNFIESCDYQIIPRGSQIAVGRGGSPQ
ncbi:MAG: hypothetical protein JNJ60_24220 [Rhodocyclaceae bacterium]|nr:hypothetical protein [Rhodocyclaceae bacterium]